MGKTAMIIVGVLLLIVLVFGGAIASGYNTLVGKRNIVDSNWAQVENQLQRRADLIPNLVNTVKGYANLEQETLTRIADARSRILSPTATPEQKMEAANQMSTAPRQAGLLPGGDGGMLGSGGRF